MWGMVALNDGSAIVVRFAPFTREGLEKSAAKQALSDQAKGRPARRGVSVFATHVDVGESLDDAVRRICEHASRFCGGERVAVVAESTLNQEGYALHLSEPPDAHYLVGTADLSELPDFSRLAELLRDDRRDNPGFRGRG
ncbi:hypothetical protein GCM10010932_02140 [Agromyces flavus]|nr:hypothetical protein GCM10010932_02140 [Agromyces flavus]